MIDLESIPINPGVYLMKDKLDNIIYVGKAKNLKKRVKQYFDKSAVEKRGQKIIKMVSLINDIEWIITNTEVEALILENNLIKEHNPKYNTLLRDDKTYPYIKITDDDFPKIIMVRKLEKDNAKYFGPYTDVTAINNTIDLLKDIFKIRHCDHVNLPKKDCMYNQMNKCMAPCIKECKDEYNKNILEIIRILSGNNSEIVGNLKEQMLKYSDEMNYEYAAKYRDLISGLNKIVLKQNINCGFDSQDVINYKIVDDKAVVVILFIRNGKMVNRSSYYLENPEENELLSSFIKQYYYNVIDFPSEIIIPENINDLDVLNQWINEKSSKTKILIAKKGHKHSLCELAKKNADLIIGEDLRKIKQKSEKMEEELAEIQKIIGLNSLKRIEAYDISNTSGVLNVASMVVFEDGQPKNSAYRKFKLDVIGADDYKCMEEVIRRRFTDSKMKFYPNLLLIDGGKGQVNIVENVLKTLDIKIPVCGMVKDDNHRTRGLFYQNKEYNIKKSINLITRIQDETHRFAVTYHSLLRTKDMLHSILDDIPGIGSKKRQILMQELKSIDNIKNADENTLLSIKGISKTDAKNIIEFFKT